jgi:hypothetical protein
MLLTVVRNLIAPRRQARKEILSSTNFAPLRETQFFRSLFHPKFQISLASIFEVTVLYFAALD